MIGLFYWACGAVFGVAVSALLDQSRQKKQQATRANMAQVELHIERQKTLGEDIIGDNDIPTRWDFIATLATVALIAFGSLRGWW